VTIIVAIICIDLLNATFLFLYFQVPYHWAWLPQAKVAFSLAIRDHLLPLLSDMNFVQEMCSGLYQLFKVSHCVTLEGQFEATRDAM
jgi:hypothetical protein